jgi:hypothetical protein
VGLHKLTAGAVVEQARTEQPQTVPLVPSENYIRA